MNFILSTEDTCDLSEQTLRAKGISHIKMAYRVGEDDYGADSGRALDNAVFFDRMRNGERTSTSMINEQCAYEYFSALLQSEKDVLHIAFASACSGTYDSLRAAAERVNEEYPNKVYVVDSKCESTGEGLLVVLCAEYAEQGHTVLQTKAYAEETRGKVNLLFTVDNLKYLAAGGRVTKTTAFIGNLLSIKPLLYVNEAGQLIPAGKVMTRKLSLNRLIEKTKEKFSGESRKIYVSHGDCLQDAKFVAAKLSEALDAEVAIEEIGTVIGSHSGPGTLAVFFLGRERSF